MSSVKPLTFVEQARLLAVASYQRAETVPLDELLPAARAWLLENADLCDMESELTAALPYCWTRSVVVEIAQLQMFTDAVNTVLLAARCQKELVIGGKRYHRQPIQPQQLQGFLADFRWSADHVA